MREILFRGKPINKSDGANSWIEGFYTKSPSGRTRILTTYNASPIEVIPESVGQFTGLIDKNGKKIFEGDIVECFRNGLSYVAYRTGCFGLIYDYTFINFHDVHGEMIVIGNIFDHPHLLKEGVTL